MQHVAEQFTKEEGQARYLAAAKAFRMPFWGELTLFPMLIILTCQTGLALSFRCSPMRRRTPSSLA